MREWSKIKLTFSEKDLDKLLERMAKDNKNLRHMLKDSGIIGELTLSCKAVGSEDGYSVRRKYARSLYTVLNQSFASACRCSMPHSTNLRLEARRHKKRSLLAEIAQENLTFTMMFSLETDSIESGGALWNWRRAIIEPLRKEDFLAQPLAQSSQNQNIVQSRLSGTEHNTLCSVSAATSSGLRTALAIGSPEAITRSAIHYNPFDSHHSTDHVNPLRSRSYNELTTTEKISSICKAIRTVGTDDSCLRVLVDELDRQHRISMIQSLQSTRIISLKNLLEENTDLTHRDRLTLGFKLAATLLQLYRTPWLAEVWGRDDIVFIQMQNRDSPSAFFQEPFITRSFSPNHELQAETIESRPQRQKSLSVRVPPLFSLGILLIELSYCKPIEALGPSADLPGVCADRVIAGMCQDDIRFLVALHLLEPGNQRGLNHAWTGQRYADAVRRCIRCDLDISEGDYDSDAFHSAVYRGVVEPLMQTLRSHCGENDDLLDAVLS